MAPQDQTARIHRDAFVISTSVLFAVALLAVMTRFIIRFYVQKQKLLIDDGFLVIALGCLLTSLAAMYTEVLDRMYYIVELQNEAPGVTRTEDWLMIYHQFHKWVTICNMAGWCAVMAIKFSFLFFFRRLAERLQYFNYYCGFLIVYNIGCLGHGVAVYYIGCPFYFDDRELQCATGPYKELLFQHSLAQMILDLVGDAMILAIPIYIIWKTRVQWPQRVALMCSLGLTAFMVATTIIRVAGIIYMDQVDTIWGLYWTLISAEIGVLMAAATAFRTFFVTHQNSKDSKPKERLRYSFPRFLLGKLGVLGDTVDVEKGYESSEAPHAQIISMRTSISRSGKAEFDTSTQANHPSQPDANDPTNKSMNSRLLSLSANGNLYF